MTMAESEAATSPDAATTADPDPLATHAPDLGPTTTLKSGPLFMVTQASGDVPAQSARTGPHGLGLYFHDTRFLDEKRMQVNGRPMTLLFESADLGDRCTRELTNPDLPLPDGRGTIRKETIGLHVDTALDGELREVLTFSNFSREALEVTLTLAYGSAFDDIFTVRGMKPGARGRLDDPAGRDDVLRLGYSGADHRRRTTEITFDPAPAGIAGACATFHLRLAPGGDQRVEVVARLSDRPAPGSDDRLEVSPIVSEDEDVDASGLIGLPSAAVRMRSSNELFNRVMRRSFLDLAMLDTRQGDDRFFAAGVPWYVALFGRDSIITALETLAFAPEVGRSTLEVLARHQGREHDPGRDEEPGKILHELQGRASGPSSGRCRSPPTTARWTRPRCSSSCSGSTCSGRVTSTASRRCVPTWMPPSSGSSATATPTATACSSTCRGRATASRTRAGRTPTTRSSMRTAPWPRRPSPWWRCRATPSAPSGPWPTYAAWRASEERADRLEARAEEVRDRFEEGFWSPELGNYALALHGTVGSKRAAAVDASNQGQALWGGIVAPGHAGAVRDSIMDPDRLNAGWGVRTLSQAAVAYNPFDYQTGAVWPHDSAMVAVGLRSYGFDDDALEIFTGLYEAASRFDLYRLPELFAGFDRATYGEPVRYPVACSPQAWAAGSLPYLLTAVLGLVPDAFADTLHVIRPSLPVWLDWVELSGLRVGASQVDLRFERSARPDPRGGDLEVGPGAGEDRVLSPQCSRSGPRRVGPEAEVDEREDCPDRALVGARTSGAVRRHGARRLPADRGAGPARARGDAVRQWGLDDQRAAGPGDPGGAAARRGGRRPEPAPDARAGDGLRAGR